jgi:hypothetical protein
MQAGLEIVEVEFMVRQARELTRGGLSIHGAISPAQVGIGGEVEGGCLEAAGIVG